MMASPKCFTPHPSPLADVPREYIAQQLHSLAPLYWNKPETADCTIVVPFGHPRLSPRHHAADPSHVTSHLTLQLHMDYLCAKSSLLRGLFGGYSYLDLVKPDPSASSPSTSRTSGCLQPHLLPSSRPVLLLPVPDPRSIHLLVHWIYFGKADLIETCLNEGVVDWEGLTQNVEYLGLTTDIKVFLGRWYDNWLLPTHDRSDICSPDEDVSSSSSLSSSGSRTSSPCEEVKGVRFERGRTRVVRPLSRSCRQLPLYAAA
ncbi:hypothetical protein F5J12DRAFT_443698 [Pisolithus orientalis]|uniref:uncharacterized protein n=1 Tax=Pisolithus orientalis TaxID=936130 RepID=UPI0022245E16|nr:uncharacterized protein F5J12DRAFT_443698 [Pisolithus orientalis]KAI6025677.1 hypothetical protein F5J12DRAFT_443698 [Pisolithus orientalis]